jgi:MoxR-like ATPase
MRKGAVLLIDEIDLASNKIMCLQSILEGKGYLNKKTGEYVSPEDGFTIVATANTKGKGSDDGRFIGTNVLNEAFLERFSITSLQNV